MYPLNVTNPKAGGFAVANDEAEHKALTEAGYGPAWVAPTEPEALTVEELRAKLDAAGIEYDKRWGVEKLKAALPQE
jgi:hypothetical protein